MYIYRIYTHTHKRKFMMSFTSPDFFVIEIFLLLSVRSNKRKNSPD